MHIFYNKYRQALLDNDIIRCDYYRANYQLNHRRKRDYNCCENMNLIYDNVCFNCVCRQGFNPVVEYFDFDENMHTLNRKSICNRKYHIKVLVFHRSEYNNIKVLSSLDVDRDVWTACC